MSADGVVAGKLVIPVESDTSGFAKELKTQIEAIAKQVEAKIAVALDSESVKELKGKLEAAADKAAEGVVAKIGVDVDAKTLKAKLKAAAKAAGTEAKITLAVEDASAELTRARARADAASKNPVKVAVKAVDHLTAPFFGWLARARAAARAGIKVPVKSDGKDDKGGKGFELPDFLKQGPNARSAFMPTIVLGVLSLIQPLIATVVGSLGGLAAMAANAAAALNLLGAAPALFLAMQSAIMVTRLAFGNLFGDIKDVPPHLMSVRKEFDKLKKPWEEMTKGVGKTFWKDVKDDIEPTGKVLIPILRKGLEGVAFEMGQVADNAAHWMRTPLFKGQATTIFKSISQLTRGFSEGLLGGLQGLTNITVAAAPVLSKFSDVMSNFGKWASDIGNTAEEQERLGEMFEYGWQKASQLWRMAKDLGASIKAIFSAGRESGDELLGSLEDNIQKFRDWATSTEGQERIKQWFENVKPIAEAAGRVIVALGAAIARLAEDSTTAGLLDRIATELIPKVEQFFKSLGTTLGPQVVGFVTSILEVLTVLSEAGGPLANGLRIINGLLLDLAGFLGESPVFARNLGVLLGAFLGFRALTFFTPIIPMLTTFFGLAKRGPLAIGGLSIAVLTLVGAFQALGAGDGITGPALALAGFLTVLGRIPIIGKTSKGALDSMKDTVRIVGMEYQRQSQQVGGFKGKIQGLGAAVGYGGGVGVRGAIKGLTGALGGPWGIAMAGASMAIGGFIEAQMNAKAAADGLMSTIDEMTGKFTKGSESWLTDSILGDFEGDDVNRLRELGINFQDLGKAVASGGTELEMWKAKIQSLKNSAGTDWLFVEDDIDLLNALESSLQNNGEVAYDAKAKFDALNPSLGSTGSSANAAEHGMNGLNGAIDETIPPAETLADRLERLMGITLDGREADRRYEEAKASLLGVVQKGDKVYKDSAGNILNTTEAGRRYNQALDSMAKAAYDSAKADLEQGKGVDEVKKKVEGAKKVFIDHAVNTLGMSKKAAEDLAKKLGLSGDAVDDLNEDIKGLKGKTVTVGVNDQASGKVSGIKAALASIKDRFVSVYTSVSGIASSMFKKADGGLVEFFANGGMRENHIAQIARAGDWRVWAEPETEGEAYIPLARSKRPRSLAVLAEVAKRFGMMLAPQFRNLHAASNSLANSLGVDRRAQAIASAMGLSVEGSSRETRGAQARLDRLERLTAQRALSFERNRREVVFHNGAIQINNPAPETAAGSLAGTLRNVGTFGLFGDA